MILAPPGLPAGWRWQGFAELPSTQALLIRLAEAGEPERLAVLAQSQTAGRGSRGRSWQSGLGNLALSVLLRPAEPARNAGQWALLSAVALLEALEPSAPPGSLSLKWPNDLLLGRRKLGGILLDSRAGADGSLDWLAIGIGANLAAAPDGLAAAVLPKPCDPVAAACHVLARIDHWRRVRLLDGFAPVRRAWLDRAHPRGTRLRVRGAGYDTAGDFEGLSDDGALLLATGGRVHAFSTGTVLEAEG